MAEIDKDRLAKMLVLGIPQVKVAIALGISEGRISQLKTEDDELIGMIAKFQGKRAEHEIKQDASLEQIERNLLERSVELSSTTESLAEAINAFHKIQDAKAKKALMQTPVEQPKLELHLSDMAIGKLDIHMDGNRNILSIRGKTMATMPAKNVKEIIEAGVQPR